MNKCNVNLFDVKGNLFERVEIPITVLGKKPEAVLFADRIFLPDGRGSYRECNFAHVSLPWMRSLAGT